MVMIWVSKKGEVCGTQLIIIVKINSLCVIFFFFIFDTIKCVVPLSLGTED